MRALILLLAAAVVALAISIVVEVDTRPSFAQRMGPVFHIGALLANAEGGESAWYRETSSGRSLEYRVVQAPRLPPIAVAYKVVGRRLLDEKGQPYAGAQGSVSYEHKLTDHGFLPLAAPEAPQALDRVWIIRAIRPDSITLDGGGGTAHACWRVDLIDPALPEGQDTVVAWVSDKVPVYGLLKLKRAGETWEFVRGEFAQGGAR
ncbi:MAG: hypothetical protein O2894_04540 [Planctomycetota bacterium]|nr:hypothetical protein [Planctomycetota bacterium]